MPTMSWAKFASMIAISTIVMFVQMYLYAYTADQVIFSQTRMWMAVMMGAVMAIIMLGFMWSMYPRRVAKLVVVAGGIAVSAGSLALVRSQQTVDDMSWMQAMIPRHSIAV